MPENNFQVGSVVLSTQGRDKGNFFVVTAIGKNTLMVADGEYRKLSLPKKKNIKHVSNSGVVLNSIAEKLLNGKKVFDSELKSAIRQFAEKQG